MGLDVTYVKTFDTVLDVCYRSSKQRNKKYINTKKKIRVLNRT